MTPAMVTQFGMPPHRIDRLSAIDGVTFQRGWAGAAAVIIQGQPMRVIGLAELRANKASTGRPRDAEDVRRLTKRTQRKKR